MRIGLILFLALLLAILVTIFAVQNTVSVDITFLTWEIHGSLALILIITLALGILIGLLVSTPASIKRRLQLADLRKKQRSLEKDLIDAREAVSVPEELPTAQPTPEITSEEKPHEDPIQGEDDQPAEEEPTLT